MTGGYSSELPMAATDSEIARRHGITEGAIRYRASAKVGKGSNARVRRRVKTASTKTV